MLRLGHSGNFRNLFLSFPAKPGLPTAPQQSNSEARAPHSPPAQYQQSQGSPQPPAQYQQSQGSPQPPAQYQRSQGSPQPPAAQYQHRSQGSPQPPAQYQRSQGSPQPPSTVPAKPGLPTAPQHSTSTSQGSPQPPAQYQRSQGSPQPPSTVPAKPGLPTAPQHSTSQGSPSPQGSPQPPAQYQRSQGSPQHSTSEARAQYQQSQGSPQPPQHSTSKARAPLSRTSEARAPTAPPAHPSAVSATRDHHGDCLPLSSARRSSKPPGTITGTACLSPVPEEAPSHQGPSQGLPTSLQCQKKLPATRDHHRDCLPLSSARRSSQPPGTITGTACLSLAPEEAPSHQGPSQGLPASLQHQKKLPATGDHHRACLSSVNIHWIFIHSNWKHHD